MEDIMSQDTTGNNTESQRPTEISDGIFARQLFKMRKAAGLTQEQLAERMTTAGNTMHRSAIAKIEAGERSVSIGEAVQFAGVLGVDLGELTADRYSDTEAEREHRARVELQVQVRSLLRLAEERQRLLDEAQYLFENAVDRLRAARDELSKLELRIKVREQQAKFGTSAWMTPDSEDDQ